jgi:hypothetical protein
VSLFFPTYRTIHSADGSSQRIDGVFTLVIVNDGNYWLQPMYVYQDGLIDCRGFIDFERLKVKVRAGWIVSRPPEGVRIIVPDLVSFTAVGVDLVEDPEDFLKEVACQLDILRGEDTAAERCRQVLESYEREPNAENRRALAAAYDAVPLRRRRREIGRGQVVERRIRAALGDLPRPAVEET